jgi:hypothetical protein
MTLVPPKNLARSVRDRLLELANARGVRLSVGACDYCSETLGSLVSVGATFLTMTKKACGLV